MQLSTAQLLELNKYYYGKTNDDSYAVDCWQFVQRFYKLVLGIDVDDYLDVYEGDDYAPLTPTIERAYSDGWVQITASPTFGDVGIWSWDEEGVRTHAGVLVATKPNLMVYHVPLGCGARLEKVDRGSWPVRLVAWFRHPLMQSNVKGDSN